MRITRKIKNNNGLSLVELLVALSLVSMVILVVMSMSLFGLRSFDKGINQSDVQFEVRRASAKITEELRNAIAIETSTSTSSYLTEYIDIESELGYLDSTCTVTVSDNILTLYLRAEKEDVTKDNISYELTTDILLNNYPINITCPSIDVTIINYNLPDEDNFTTTSP
jgi:prepilin-type N-terminal cleavage/methylation domain-containing protein